MQFFDRSDVPRAASQRVQAPISLVGPDGQLYIGLPPEGRTSTGSGRVRDGETGGANATGSVQLLHPCSTTVQPSPRWWLHGVIAIDIVMLVNILGQNGWAGQGFSEYLRVISITALIVDGFGVCACEMRRPDFLGFYAVIVGVQFLSSLLWLFTPVS